jgi:Holliday junction DNA helicase RuvA
MISSIKGKLSSITDQYALVEIGGVSYEILLPSALAERLKSHEIGHEIEFKTIYYIEAGDKKSNHYPRLVGFERDIDKEFFSLFTQVPGMGIKKALKSLIIPIKDIATAIETRNPGGLSLLPGVGGRLAEKIIAELHGKTSKYALSKGDQPLAVKETKKTLEPLEKEAIDVLIQLQYKINEAQEMVSRAVQDNPKVSKVEDLISIIFKNVQSNQ